MPDYCNTTTDLQRVFPLIEQYQAREILHNISLLSGTVYKQDGTGHVSSVRYGNGTVLTEASSAPSPISSLDEGEFYYDSDNDVLYMNDGIDLTGETVEVGEDWDSFKTEMRDKAQQIIDAYLNNMYVTPLVPRSRKTHDSADYEYPIVRAAALCTCWLIMSRVDPRAPEVMAIKKEFYNPNPEPGETKGLINQLTDGEMVLQDQISVREVGSWNVYPYAFNSVDVNPILFGIYTGSAFRVWRVQVDGGGTPDSATFKVSYDGGGNWDVETVAMQNDDDIRVYVSDGVYAYWPNVTYTTGDYWDLELHPLSDTATGLKISSIKAVR